jgi:hypothetical protein
LVEITCVLAHAVDDRTNNKHEQSAKACKLRDLCFFAPFTTPVLFHKAVRAYCAKDTSVTNLLHRVGERISKGAYEWVCGAWVCACMSV